MKQNQDIINEVLSGMVQSGTLTQQQSGIFEIPEGIQADEVRSAIVRRMCSLMNEELKTPYGRARVDGRDTKPIITEALERFKNLINKVCKQLLLSPFREDELNNKLNAGLDQKYLNE